MALCALALGEIRYVDRPLYDYVQHGGATSGTRTRTGCRGLRERFASLRRDPRERVRVWRMHYFADACRLIQFATMLRDALRRADGRAKRRALDAFVRRPLLAPLRGSRARRARGRRAAPETLGGEWMLRTRSLAPARSCERPRPAARRLRSMPFRRRAGAAPRAGAPPTPSCARSPARSRRSGSPSRQRAAARQRARTDARGPTRRSQLARRLAGRGLRVRVITVDPSGLVPRAQARALAPVELEYGRESLGVEISRADTFVATTWWTAHIARAALREVEAERFLYLIEEYAPLAMPPGSLAALAIESYRFPHAGLYASEMLHDYFRAHRIAAENAAVFEPAVTVSGPRRDGAGGDRAARRALLFDAGSMFELGILALSRALELGAFRTRRGSPRCRHHAHAAPDRPRRRRLAGAPG